MKNSINLKIDLPQEVIARLEQVIVDTVTRTIKLQVADIKSEPKMFTRKEAAKNLRITLPTLRVYEINGRSIPKRAGKRVPYSKDAIETFIGIATPIDKPCI